MRRFTRIVGAVLLGSVVFWGEVQGQITEMYSTINTECYGELPGYQTNDLYISFEGQYTGSSLVVELESGDIYQDEFGGTWPPEQTIVDSFPSIACDTFLALGSDRDDGSIAFYPSLLPPPVDLGGSGAVKFDEEGIEASWNPPAGSLFLDEDDFLNARLTLSGDANGTVSFLASAGGVISQIEFSISNGQIKNPGAIWGDYDNNGSIGQGDLDLVLLNWGVSAPPFPNGWINDLPLDGTISQNELDVPFLSWGSEAAATAVPEPGALMLLGVGACGWVCSTRRRG